MKIFILFALVTVSVCNDGGNLYDSDSRSQVGCGPYGSSSGGSFGGSNSGESISSVGSSDGSLHSGGSSSSGVSSSGSIHSGGSISGQSLEESSSYNYSKSYSQHYQHYNFQCTSEYKNALKGDKQCMLHALQKVSDLTTSLTQLMCKYTSVEADYDQLTVELTKVAKCAGCGLGDPLGLKELGQTTGEVGKVGGEAVKTLLHHVLEKVKITRPVFDLACNLLGPALTSTCLKEITTTQISSVTGDAKAFLCRKKESLDLPQLYDVLEKVDCVLDKTVKVKKETFGDLTKQIGESVLPLVNKLVAVLKEVPIVTGLLCTVGEILNTVVNGGGSEGGVLDGVLGGGGGLLGGVLGVGSTPLGR